VTATPAPALRNALWMVIAQVLSAPVSLLINAITARYLGPADFGTLYLATTYIGFGFVFVEWGQFGALTGKIAADRSRAGELLGSALVWRLAAAVVVASLVVLLCALAGYGRPFLTVLMLMAVAAGLGTLALAGQDAVRGFERTDFAALSYLGQQLLVATVTISVLTAGFGLRGLLLGQVLCAVIAVVFVRSMLPRLQIPQLFVRRHTIGELFRDGRSFLVFVLVVQLQPLVDGAMMSHFASADAIGWYAVSRRVVGIMIFPVTAVGGALYPTLVRQFASDREGARSTVQGALRVLTLGVFPLVLGCVLFPELGVMIFNARTFAPAEQNVQVLAVWLFLLYFSIPLSQCINASGRQGRWAAVQFGCVIVSAVADPFLIPWFQAHGGNGGLGVCLAGVASEVLMVIGAILLVPKGILDRSVFHLLRNPALAGLAMVSVGLLAGRHGALLGAVLSVMSYAAVLWLIGELRGERLRSLLGMLRRRTA
jgi:O-antigen/teichoic acid export membrane protein